MIEYAEEKKTDKAIFLNGPGARLAQKKIGNDSATWGPKRDHEVLERSDQLVSAWPAFFQERRRLRQQED